MRFFLIATLLVGSLWANGFGKGMKEYRKGNFKEAFKIWEPLANNGEAGVQYYVATLYYTGKGVKQDIKKAIELYKLSAKNGCALSVHKLETVCQEHKDICGKIKN